MTAVLVQLGGEKGKVKEEKRKKRKEERKENESGGEHYHVRIAWPDKVQVTKHCFGTNKIKATSFQVFYLFLSNTCFFVWDTF